MLTNQIRGKSKKRIKKLHTLTGKTREEAAKIGGPPSKISKTQYRGVDQNRTRAEGGKNQLGWRNISLTSRLHKRGGSKSGLSLQWWEKSVEIAV